MSETPTTPPPAPATGAATADAAPPSTAEADGTAPGATDADAAADTEADIAAETAQAVPAPVDEPAAASAVAPTGGADAGSQTSLAAPAAPVRGLTYAVDIVFCIDVTGSMTPILDAVKANALRFYGDVQSNLVNKGKNVDELRVRVVAFRDFTADGDAAMQESPFFALPADQGDFSAFVNGLVPEGGGDAPESGLEAVSLAMASPWTTRGDRRRQVIVVWTDQPAQPLSPAALPEALRGRVPADFSALTDMWEDAQGALGSSSKRLILFAPDGPGWSDISSVWENVVHHPSQAGGGLSDVDYGTIIDSIGNSV
jgi:von Willebrand factor type A domain